MMTFGDLMSQLLTFFVLLVSFSIFDEIKYNNVKGALEYSFGMLPAWDQPLVPKERVVKREEHYNTEEKKIKGIGYKLKVNLAKEGKGGDLTVETTKEGLLLALKEETTGDSAYFDTAEANLKPEAYPVLDAVVEAIKDLENEIRVRGHTDRRPLKPGGKFPSNWELSSARARSVQKYLVDGGIDEERTSVMGYAHVKPRVDDEKIEDPLEKKKAWSENRRVEILIVRQAEPTADTSGMDEGGPPD